MGEAQRKGETLSRRVQTGFDPETGEAIFEEEQAEVLPFIVVVIDELMMVAGKDIEAAVQKRRNGARRRRAFDNRHTTPIRGCDYRHN